MYDIVSLTYDMLDKTRPVHLLGIGNVIDIFHGVLQGIDTFDCVYPTRIARHGAALVKPENRDMHGREYINLNSAKFRTSTDAIEQDCICYTCRTHSKGYLHHLLKAKELLAYSLITIHNIQFMNDLMQLIRKSISNNSLQQELTRWS
ncbi:Queuine tRNA-ribosyltransferase [Anaplasma phagocytophilum]|nr:Queuine tRNA-ribosyltransferase [Anaplasma phagocytophilum]